VLAITLGLLNTFKLDKVKAEKAQHST